MSGFVTKRLKRPKALGAVLKGARTKREVTIEQAEKETRIAGKYLQALEDGNFSALPAEAYNIGFVRTYAEYLRLDPHKIVGMYREERSAHHFTPAVNTVGLAPRRTRDWQFLITPKIIGVAATILVFGAMASYIFVQFNKFSQPPEITLAGAKEFTSDKDTVNLAGATVAGSIVSMNGETISVNTDGSFNQPVQLAPGVNEFRIVARNRAQKESQVAVKVLYDQGVAKLPSTDTTVKQGAKDAETLLAPATDPLLGP